MDLLTRDSELIPCPHCGHELRKGMIRCRECNGVVNEDFVLSEGAVLVESPVHRCAKCGTALESGVDDCPACASAMLDELLSAVPENAAKAPERPRAMVPPATSSESRLRDYTPFDRPEKMPAERAAPKGGQSKGKGKRRAAADRGAAALQTEEPGTDALYESETDVRSSRSSTTVPDIQRPVVAEPEASPESSTVPEQAASEACQSLLAALATPDADALCKVVTALGKLGDKQAQGPLERLMINPEIRVRRATAEALIALGHPKGKALLEIAERRIAAPSTSTASGFGKARKNRAPTDWGAMLKPALALVGVAIVGGGIWWWQSRPAAPKAAKKVTSPKAATAGMKPQPPQTPPAAPVAPRGPSVFDN